MYKKGRVNSNSRIISTDEDPSLRIESSAIINLRGVSTKLNKYIVFTMQTYKKLKCDICKIYAYTVKNERFLYLPYRVSKKMVIELWHATGHSIFNIQK